MAEEQPHSSEKGSGRPSRPGAPEPESTEASPTHSYGEKEGFVSDHEIESERSSLARDSLSPSSELIQSSWIKIVTSPALSTTTFAPDDHIDVTVELLEGLNYVELELRLVGTSQLTSRSKHEFLSVPCKFDPSLLYSLSSYSTSEYRKISVTVTIPGNHTCDCSRSGSIPSSSIPIPPSYESGGNRIMYTLEAKGRYEDLGQARDKKGKGKWKLFGGDKRKSERLERVFQVCTDLLYYPALPNPPPLAPEETYRTYPVSQESVSYTQRITLVELKEPRMISLLAKVRNAKLILEPTTSLDLSSSTRRLLPSFKYTLLVSLGSQLAASLPLLSASLLLASSYVHFVLHESITTHSPPRARQSTKKVIKLVQRDRGKLNPVGAGAMHKDREGIVDAVYELVSEEGEEEMRETFVKFQGELEVNMNGSEQGRGQDEVEKRLVPIRTCQLEVRYDLTTTFQFGEGSDSLVMLKSTNLPLHLEAEETSRAPGQGASGSLSPPPVSKTGILDQGIEIGSSSTMQRPSESTRHPEDLPVYEAGERTLLSPREEKLRIARTEDQDLPRSTQPPAYGTSRSLIDDEPGVGDDSVIGRVGEGDEGLPPSWEETVRDDMIDDWVAASVALGAGEDNEGSGPSR